MYTFIKKISKVFQFLVLTLKLYRFNLEIKDTEFESFVENLPQNEEGQIYYAKFMSQFDTRFEF